MPVMSRRFWTTHELNIVREFYPNTPMCTLMLMLNRPSASIYAKAKELRVKRSREFLLGEFSGRIRSGDIRGRRTQFQSGKK